MLNKTLKSSKYPALRPLNRQLVDAENSKPEYNSGALIILRVKFFTKARGPAAG